MIKKIWYIYMILLPAMFFIRHTEPFLEVTMLFISKFLALRVNLIKIEI